MNSRFLAMGGLAAAVIAVVAGGLFFGWDFKSLVVGASPAPTAVPPSDDAVPPTPTAVPASYEAVFLRRDPSADVLVIGVDAHGQERVITRLADGWAWEKPPTPDPAGALSPSGLLAMAVMVEDPYPFPNRVRWTIFDVGRHDATPLVIAAIPEHDTDQITYSYFRGDTIGDGGRPLWGPGDRLAIYWYERIPIGPGSFGRHYWVTFVEGRTGEATSVDIQYETEFRPFWAADGSGILLADGQRVLGRDGMLAPAADVVEEASCHRVPQPDGDLADGDQGGACLSPDDSLTVAPNWGRVDSPRGFLTVQATGESFEVLGRFAGWLAVDQ